MKLLLFMGFVNVYIHFRICIRQKLRILADPDPQHWEILLA
jgi:hypothetical protein